MSPAEQDGEYGRGQKRPFVRAFHDHTAQQEEEAHYGAHIDRACRERLFAPIRRAPFGKSPSSRAWIALAYDFIVYNRVFAHVRGAGASLEVRNHQGHSLAHTVAPSRSVVYVKSLLPFSAGLQFGMSSADGLLKVFGIRLQGAVAGSYSYAHCSDEDRQRYGQFLDSLLLNVNVYLRDSEKCHHHKKIIGHLRVLHHSYGAIEHYQGCAQRVFSSEYQEKSSYHGSHHP